MENFPVFKIVLNHYQILYKIIMIYILMQALKSQHLILGINFFKKKNLIIEFFAHSM